MTPTSSDEVLSIPELSALSHEIAAEYDPRLQIGGVASTDGDSGRVELLMTIRGCHKEPCVLMVNVTRTGQAAFEGELRSKLRDALAAHVTSE